MTTTALRRQFLTDLAFPDTEGTLCNMLGLPPASPSVSEAEAEDARAFVLAVLGREGAWDAVSGAASDAASVLTGMDADSVRVWLVSYAVAMLRLFESLGVVNVKETM